MTDTIGFIHLSLKPKQRVSIFRVKTTFCFYCSEFCHFLQLLFGFKGNWYENRKENPGWSSWSTRARSDGLSISWTWTWTWIVVCRAWVHRLLDLDPDLNCGLQGVGLPPPGPEPRPGPDRGSPVLLLLGQHMEMSGSESFLLENSENVENIRVRSGPSLSVTGVWVTDMDPNRRSSGFLMRRTCIGPFEPSSQEQINLWLRSVIEIIYRKNPPHLRNEHLNRHTFLFCFSSVKQTECSW